MKAMTEINRFTKGTIVLVLIVAFVLSFGLLATADPQGATINSNSTDTGPTTTPDNRSDDGGTITFLNMSSIQQNAGWKAYIGNVTGTLTLDDANSQTIYDWTLSGSPSGEVYVSRDSNVNWGGTIQCAQPSTISNEQSVIGGTASDADSINNTYNESQHPTMQVGGTPVDNSTCPTAYTYINDASQTASENNNFTAILLEDGDSDLIYATFLEQDATGFDGSTYDFQMIVPDQENGTIATYYFYLEISS